MVVRSIIIALFLTLAAFAQEAPAHYYPATNSDGKKRHYTQQDSIVADYSQKIYLNTRSANRSSKQSTLLFISGSIGVVSGVGLWAMIISSLKRPSKTESKPDTRSTEDIQISKNRNNLDTANVIYDMDESTGDGGFLLFATMGTGFIIGGGIGIYGSYKLKQRSKDLHRQAEFYEKQLQTYRQQNHSVSLEISPTFNLIDKAFGGNLLLEF